MHRKKTNLRKRFSEQKFLAQKVKGRGYEQN